MLGRAALRSILIVAAVAVGALSGCKDRRNARRGGTNLPANAAPARSDAAAPIADAAASPACTFVENDYGPEGALDLDVEVFVSGLRVPWGVAFLPGGDLLVNERRGAIRLIRGGRLEPRPVATIAVVSPAEGGLLGLALDPDFANNRAFYIYLTAKGRGGAAENRVERWILSPDSRSARRDRAILGHIPAARFHDGGFLAFGPDGYLYVGTGDARHPDRAQDPKSLSGKILRVTRDGEPAPGNPWPKNPAYVIGVRNTEGFDWRDDGSMVIADHGPSGELGRTGHDEVSVVAAEKLAGANLGWPTIYGCQRRPGMVTPAISWKQAVPPGGAHIVRGRGIAAWRGDLVLGTLRSHHLHHIVFDRAGRVRRHDIYLTDRGRLRGVTEGPDGALYVLTSNCDGRGECPASGDVILRVTARK